MKNYTYMYDIAANQQRVDVGSWQNDLHLI